MIAARERWNGHVALLFLALALAALLRFYDLSGVPSELIADELDLYNSAHSIATTGHDVDGSLLPFFYSHFTRNPPIYGIAMYASRLVFGKNPFALRLPAALLGVASVYLLYLIALELSRRRDVALVAAALMATEPVFVHFSRVGWEPAAELPFLLGGLYALLVALGAPEGTPLPRVPIAVSATLLALTCYTYMAGWFYAVVLAGALLGLNFHRFAEPVTRRRLLAGCALWLALSSGALWMWFGNPLTAGKAHRISTFAYGVDAASAAAFFVNYAKQFDWSFLATTGDPITGATWRYLVGFGAFFPWVVPLAALGLVALKRVVPQAWARRWIWAWLLAYPLGGALTNEAIPNAPRTLAGMPVFCILAAVAAGAIFDAAANVRVRRALHATFAALALGSTALFASYYFTQFVHVYPNAWDSGTRQLFGTIARVAPHYRIACFSLYPSFYATETYVRYYLDHVPLQTLDSVDDPRCYAPGALLIFDTSQPRALPPGFRRLALVTDVDGEAFAELLGRPLPYERLPVPASP
jgi:4-amino-4-deoxy-L-arabinose transferase-like glycosyltransferase